MRWKLKCIFFSFCNLYSSNMIKILKEDDMDRHAGCVGEKRKRKPEGNRPLGGLKHSWKDDIKMDRGGG
jgi:hypothetical protein